MTAIPPTAATPRLDLRLPVAIGLAGLVALLLICGGWAATTRISGAVIAHGEVVVEGRPKLVQSLDGGVAHEILVREGDRVADGQLLLRLDPTLLETNLGIARARLAAALTQQARLAAERDGRETIDFSYPPLPFAPPSTAAEEDGQRRIFEARRAVMSGARARLAERLAQFDSQIAGISAQIVALGEQLALVESDIGNQEDLAAKGLARRSQVSEVLRQRAELQGQRAALEAQRAGLANARQDAEIETLQVERSFMEEVVTEQRRTGTEIEELTLEIVTRSAELARTEIRAPAAGVVTEMSVTTVGGVVPPRETILQVVPTGQDMEFELKVDPRAIDQVHLGQPAELMVLTFDPQAVPRIAGKVTAVAAAASTDPRSGAAYYRVGLAVTPEELARLGSVALLPGMPVEAYLQTADRSVLTYLLQPISRHLARAFRE